MMMPLYIRAIIVTVVAGSLAILPGANALAAVLLAQQSSGPRLMRAAGDGDVAALCSSGPIIGFSAGSRQLSQPLSYSNGRVVVYNGRYVRRTLTSVDVDEAKEEQPQHSLHVNATGLPTNCTGCTVAITLIQTYLCSTTTVHENALQFPLETVLTYLTDENGSTNGWKSQTFRELLKDSNSTLPMSLVDVLNPATPTDYKVAVYLYDMDENPIACATLEPASEEEAKMYEDLFYGGSEEGGDGSDAADAADKTLGDNTSSGDLKLVSTIVTGMSLLASVILIFS